MDFSQLVDFVNPGKWISEYQRQWERKEDIERAQRNADADRAMQYDFAQNSLTWQYNQMNQAGLNPASSVSGANTPSFMPSGGQSGPTSSPDVSGETLKWASKTQREADELKLELLRSQVDRSKLENDALLGQLNQPKMSTTRAKIEPKMGIDPKGSEWVTFATQPDGGLRPVPSQQLKQLIEDSPYEWEHWVKEGLLPRLGINTSTKPPRTEEMKKNNVYWLYHAGRGAYYKSTQPSKYRDPNRSFIDKWMDSGSQYKD
ncbi:MAG: DNA pilot protein [Microviridae sp.]|nr:MAG: DNA pilot protein [Microviridae sp.]